MAPTLQTMPKPLAKTSAKGPNSEPDMAQVDALLAKIRTPSAPLPDTVNEAFLASVMHVVNADVRKMHEERVWIRSVTGFPWPEDKPTAEDLPALYAEALKYPSFAIVVQRQFFPDDTFRGLPKNQVRRQYGDLVKRVRDKKPLPKHEKNLHVLEALQIREMGGDLKVVIGELLAAPGHLAWHAKCAKATDGLVRLEMNEDLAPVAIYLQAVLGPFKEFGEDITIGEIFEAIVVPHSLRRPIVAGLLAEEESADLSQQGALLTNKAATDRADRGDSKNDDLIFPTVDTPERCEDRWQAVWSKITALSAEAISRGPADDSLISLRGRLMQLEDVHATFMRLTPPSLSTDEVREKLRNVISSASDGLDELHGERLNAPALLSALFEIDALGDATIVQKAASLCRQANVSLAEAISLAAEITDLMATLPTKKARDQTDPLIDRRDALLRQSLGLAQSAINLLPRSSTDSVAIISSDAGEVDVVAQPAADLIENIIEVDGSFESGMDIPIDEFSEPYDSEATFSSPSSPRAPVETAGSPIANPLCDDVVRRLDELFSLGEHGLAFHLHQAASHVLKSSDLHYTAAEFRLASAAGRTSTLTGQDIFSLAEHRGEAISVAQSLSEQDDQRSLARRNLLLAGALPAALFRAEDVAAVSLVESIGGKGPFASYFKLVQVVEENRKRGFPLTPANVLAIEAHSRDDSFVSDAVSKIKEAIDAFRQSRFRFQLGEKVKHSLTQPLGLLGRLNSELSASEAEIARSVAETLNGRDKIVSFVDRIATDIGTGQEIDGAARERLLSVLSDISLLCSDLVQTIDGLDALRRTSGRLEHIRRLRDLALTGIQDVLADAEVNSNLLDASKVQSAMILKALGNTLRGGIVEKDTTPLAVVLHAPLLWLPKLTWTGSWTPSPYDPDRILQEIMTIDVSLRRNPARSLRNAFEERREEAAFVPAYMLLNISPWFGFKKEEADTLRSKLDADKDVKKSQVTERLKVAQRLIEKMRRMAVGSLEQSARLMETLSTIDPKRLPVELPSSFLPETLTGDRVEDFNSALARITSVEAEAQREFQRVTVDYSSQIDELNALGHLEATTEGELRNLLDRREFTTLADWLNMLRTGGVWKPRLPSGVINRRLAWFRSVLPKLGALEPVQTAKEIEFRR